MKVECRHCKELVETRGIQAHAGKCRVIQHKLGLIRAEFHARESVLIQTAKDGMRGYAA